MCQLQVCAEADPNERKLDGQEKSGTDFVN